MKYYREAPPKFDSAGLTHTLPYHDRAQLRGADSTSKGVMNPEIQRYYAKKFSAQDL
jgi:hypothetical protein